MSFLRSADDRIVLDRPPRRRSIVSASPRTSWIWTITATLVGFTVLLWVAAQIGQASQNAKGKPAPSRQDPLTSSPGAQETVVGDVQRVAVGQDSESPAPTAGGAQGPAMEVPREVLAMLDQRKQSLDRREEAVRRNEERLLALRAEVDKLLAKNEAMARRIETALAKEAQQAAGQKMAQA
ncbi:MAG: hypothetical protein NZM29_02965, partial [Nitrospira sp.]|nr:hypothetical protein [Nitrospira sp.]